MKNYILYFYVHVIDMTFKMCYLSSCCRNKHSKIIIIHYVKVENPDYRKSTSYADGRGPCEALIKPGAAH